MKNFHRTAIAFLLVLLASFVSTTFASSKFIRTGNIGSASQGRQITLKTQLTVGLKAYTKADRLFINKVITLVNQGRLKRNLVDSTFLWARKRAVEKSKSRSLRPMVYFRPGLISQAKRVGVKL